MKEKKSFWCSYCLKRTPHYNTVVMYVGNGIKKTFWDKLLKRDKAYYWRCSVCDSPIMRRKQK